MHILEELKILKLTNQDLKYQLDAKNQELQEAKESIARLMLEVNRLYGIIDKGIKNASN
jgi:hypothetical protein